MKRYSSSIWKNDPNVAVFMLFGVFNCCMWPNIEPIIYPSGHTAHIILSISRLHKQSCFYNFGRLRFFAYRKSVIRGLKMFPLKRNPSFQRQKKYFQLSE